MTHYQPHPAGRIVPARRANSQGVADFASRYPGIGEGETKAFLAFRIGRQLHAVVPANDNRLRPFIARRKAQLRAHWREGAAVAAGLLVLLITAWLIWGAFAEAALAR